MNFKKNKGYVGVDISIAVIILLILIPTIAGMIYNVNKNNNSAKIKTQAINIIVNTLETAKGLGITEINAEGIEEVTLTQGNIIAELGTLYTISETPEITENTEKTISTGTTLIEIDSVTYRLKTTITDYCATAVVEEGEEAIEQNKVKTMKAEVTYNVSGKEETIDMSTIISQ